MQGNEQFLRVERFGLQRRRKDPLQPLDRRLLHQSGDSKFAPPRFRNQLADPRPSSAVLDDRDQPAWSQRPVQTGASQATGLPGSPFAASPPPSFHTRTKK